MAVAWAFVLAVRLTPAATRWVVVSAPVAAPKALTAADKWWHRFTDPAESDAALSDLLSAEAGEEVNVATFSEPFELRKAQLQFTLDTGGVGTDDVRVITFHLIKAPGGVPTDNWVAGDFTTVDSAFTAWWASIKARFPTELAWSRLALYKEGPDITPPQLPVYDATKNVPGTSTVAMLPPQVAYTVTERAGAKKHWGRFYLPAADTASVDGFGRIAVAFSNAILDATDTLYETLNTAALPVVVYRKPLPVRQTAQEKRDGITPGSLPARDGSAWTVETLQMDSTPDVIRSRRYKVTALRSLRGIGS